MDFSFFSFFCPCLGLGEIETLEGIKKQGPAFGKSCWVEKSCYSLGNLRMIFLFLCVGICKAPAVAGAFFVRCLVVRFDFSPSFSCIDDRAGRWALSFSSSRCVRSFPPWVMCPAVVFFRTELAYVDGCLICLPAMTACPVTYARSCLSSWVYKHTSCPHCRRFTVSAVARPPLWTAARLFRGLLLFQRPCFQCLL